MRERVAKLRKQILEEKPSLSAERIVLATEAEQKYAGMPLYLHRAKVLEYVLDHKEIIICDGELLVGTLSEKMRSAAVFPELSSGRLWLKETLPTLSNRSSDPFNVNEDDIDKINKCLEWWDGKGLEDIMAEYIPAELLEMESCGCFKTGSRGLAGTTVYVDYPKLYKMGYAGMIADCEARIKEAVDSGIDMEKQRKVEYWQATAITLKAAIRYSNRYADKAEEMAAVETDEKRKAELVSIAKVCRKVPEHSPETFHEALQFQWMTHLIMHIETNATATPCCKFDEHLYPYYKHDIEAGIASDEDIVELIELFFVKLSTLILLTDNYYARANAGYPMWQVLTLGGINELGEDASTELSYLTLDAAAEMKLSQPPVALRVHDKMPDKLFKKAIKMNQDGLANPAFFSDETAMKIVLDKGGTLEEARKWVILGCVEPHPGNSVSDSYPVGGYMSAPKALEIALNNGVDPVTGKKVGPETGVAEEFTCVEELVEAVKTQILFFWSMHLKTFKMTQAVHATHDPLIFCSCFLDGVLDSARSIQEGGVKKPYTNLFMAGVATVADSIEAINYAVFEQKLLTMAEIKKLCKENFAGNERIRQMLINKPLKFGNDEQKVDKIANYLVEAAAEYVQSVPDARGGKFSMGNFSQTHNVALGAYVGATPDGRLEFLPFSDNASPSMGCDVNGPTASINSVAQLPNDKVHGGTLYNIRFDPRGVEGEKGADIIAGIVKSFCENGGFHIQINVVDDATLIEAQKHPQDYRNIVVRVAGYLAYFTELDKGVQDSIIARTAHLAS